MQRKSSHPAVSNDCCILILIKSRISLKDGDSVLSELFGRFRDMSTLFIPINYLPSQVFFLFTGTLIPMVTHLCLMEFSRPYQLDESISNLRGVCNS